VYLICICDHVYVFTIFVLGLCIHYVGTWFMYSLCWYLIYVFSMLVLNLCMQYVGTILINHHQDLHIY